MKSAAGCLKLVLVFVLGALLLFGGIAIIIRLVMLILST